MSADEDLRESGFDRQLAACMGALWPRPEGIEAAVRALRALELAAQEHREGHLARAAASLSVEVQHRGWSTASEGFAGLLEAVTEAGHGAVLETLWASTRTSTVPPPKAGPEVEAWFTQELFAQLESLRPLLLACGAEGAASACAEARRRLHSLKGAAATAGFAELARAVHALEDTLLDEEALGLPFSALQVAALEHARVALHELALEVSVSSRGRTPGEAPPFGEVESHVRVASSALTTLSDDAALLAGVGDRLGHVTARVRESAGAFDRVAATLRQVLSRLGPPRPWGPPVQAYSALRALERDARRQGSHFEEAAQGLERASTDARELARELRQTVDSAGATPARWLFDRVAPAAEGVRPRPGRSLRLARLGEQVDLDRATAERLVEPLVQLVRNAVAHGIEDAVTRVAAGKAARGTLTLEAQRRGREVLLAVEDDGGGIELSRLGGRALAQREEESSGGLRVVFEAGLSSQAQADTAAGRGVGLDLVARQVAALGGRVQLRSRLGRGSRFEVLVPARSVAERVVLVRRGAHRLAVPLSVVERLDAAPAPGGTVPPSWPAGTEPVRLWLWCASGDRRCCVPVDEYCGVSELALRPLAPWLRPWAGATDGVLDLEGRALPVVDPLR